VLGNPGQRMLSFVARAPGEGRKTNVYNEFENRQSRQGRRVADLISEGFQASETAPQAERRLAQAPDDAANEQFGAVRQDARLVDGPRRSIAWTCRSWKAGHRNSGSSFR